MEDKNMNFLNFAPLFGGEGGGGSLVITLVMLVGFGLFFYFFMIRPQKKQEKEINDMRNNLSVGDEITTIGGIIGKVVSIKEETLVLETSHDRTRIRILKTAVSRVDVKAEDAQN
jgi:preprotein translocase subunit YajC